ncbi:hypothetical protein DDB_G0270090 [Dictyostelium discoideum AX4]|uniref:Uncharacterized protein n=1 Tax=Dictyostelium discoideum TaxID=44689 RepID=Q55CE8_DICDI|nr:hypothetical protein DDB_G0270090 [Dictyostelium discoideum AX4]EAL72395.1 hypothetical protein DDB_G0270090 [Dictyostelium discoideum AX4]|eukprot:XP_646533.1 hypothetical protein DDB_G0270090 [Dictyostelium discoideum AX4]
MDNAEKEKILAKLNKINSIIEERISITSDEIEKQKVLIEQDKNNLKSLTQEIVYNEQESIQIGKEKDKLLEELAHMESQMKDFQNEIVSNKNEIQHLIAQIEAQRPNETLNILNHIFNPIGALIGDLINSLINNIRELEIRIGYLVNELNQKSQALNQFQYKREEMDRVLSKVDHIKNDLEEKRYVLEKQLNWLGIQKTKDENLKLQLELLKSQCQLLIDDTNQGKELLDVGINLVLEIEEKLKSLFSSNNIPLYLI